MISQRWSRWNYRFLTYKFWNHPGHFKESSTRTYRVDGYDWTSAAERVVVDKPTCWEICNRMGLAAWRHCASWSSATTNSPRYFHRLANRPFLPPLHPVSKKIINKTIRYDSVYWTYQTTRAQVNTTTAGTCRLGFVKCEMWIHDRPLKDIPHRDHPL